jgi:hypothetical protein
MSVLLFYWDRGRLARIKQQVHSTYLEFGNPSEVAFDASGRDARGPSKSGTGKLRMKNFWSQGLEIEE